MLIDTHVHLDYDVFAEDFEEVLRRAREAGVERVITIGTGCESSRQAVALAERHPEVFATVGVHPNQVEDEPADYLSQLRELARHPRVVAIGEIGLDYFRLPGGPGCEDSTTLPEEKRTRRERIIMRQKEVFESLLGLAEEEGLNAVIHQRASWADTTETLRRWAGRVRGVLHCFGGTSEEAREMLALGHLVSFTGIATFKNGQNMRDCAALLAPGEFMVETDAPYLAPEPHRGTRCEPWHTRLVAERLAAARGESLTNLAAHTTATAAKFFRFPAGAL
jgi:TatD DNase family protein